MPNIIIKISKIHGKGVFASRNFKKGEVVVNWSKSEGNFVNHSCNPNTKAINGCDIAIRNIIKGEEITADYIAEGRRVLNMKCNCNSKNCRRIVNVTNYTAS